MESIRSMFKILQTLRYTVHFIFLPKFPTFVFFTLILNMPAIILQTPCCHAVMTSKIPLICRSPLRVSLGTCTILWEMNNRFLYTHIIIFPSEGSITDLTLFQPGGGGGIHPPPGFSLAIATKINRSTPNFLTFNFYYRDIIWPKIKLITCQGVTWSLFCRKHFVSSHIFHCIFTEFSCSIFSFSDIYIQC